MEEETQGLMGYQEVVRPRGSALVGGTRTYVEPGEAMILSAYHSHDLLQLHPSLPCICLPMAHQRYLILPQISKVLLRANKQQ